MKLVDFPSSLQAAFGKDKIDLSLFVDPLNNPILDNVVFVDKDGVPLIPTASRGLNAVFAAPMAGPFYDLKFVGLMLNFTPPVNFRLPRWKPFRVLAEDNNGFRCFSAIFHIKETVENLHDYGRKNGINWYHGDFQFEGLKRYVKWIKGLQSPEAGGASL